MITAILLVRDMATVSRPSPWFNLDARPDQLRFHGLISDRCRPSSSSSFNRHVVGRSNCTRSTLGITRRHCVRFISVFKKFFFLSLFDFTFDETRSLLYHCRAMSRYIMGREREPRTRCERTLLPRNREYTYTAHSRNSFIHEFITRGYYRTTYYCREFRCR